MIAQRSKIAGLLAALLVALLMLPAAAQAQGLAIAPDQPTVAAGKTISFSGSGFKRGERVGLWATAPDQTVIGADFAFAKGDAGLISFSFDVPSDALGGRWSMTAYGFETKMPAITTFEVQGRDPATAAPQAQAAPTSGPPGTKFAFAAFGYKEKEKVSYWFTGPDSQIYDAYPEGAETNRDGRVDITWTAPSDAPRGAWVVTIQGLKSNIARGIPFEVR